MGSLKLLSVATVGIIFWLSEISWLISYNFDSFDRCFICRETAASSSALRFTSISDIYRFISY